MKRTIALILAVVMAFSLCACGKKNKKKDKEVSQPVAAPVATADPNQVYEIKITPENLYDFFYYKEYRTDYKGESGREINSAQISYGLQLKEAFVAADDGVHKDTMKLNFEADGVVLEGQFDVDFNTLQYTGDVYSSETKHISESLQFWPKGSRTTVWTFGNYSSSYILYLENFTVTDVSGSIFVKYAPPEETESLQP